MTGIPSSPRPTRTPTRFASIAAILVLAACSGGDGTAPGSGGNSPPTLASISIVVGSDTIAAGDVVPAGVSGRSSDGSTVAAPAVTWASSDTTVARIDSTGRIHTLGTGAFTVTASTSAAPSLSASKQLYSKSMITSLTLTRPAGSDTVALDDTVRIGVTAHDGLGNVVTGATIAWSVSDTSAAGIDGSGLLHARGMGPVTVSATVAGPAGGYRAGTSGATSVTVRLAFAHIDAGTYHTCGIARGGSVYCWGEGALGRLGDGKSYAVWTAVPQPVRVLSSKTFTNISADEQQDSRSGHTCGVTTDGTLSCWGSGAWGMLGDGATGQDFPPHLTTTPISVGSGHFVDVAVGAMNSCALDASGVAYCTGANNSKQLGVDSASSVCNEPNAPQYSENCSSTFIQVSGANTFSRIFATGYATCGITSTGDTYCWGANLAGQANYSLPPALATPTLVSSTVKFTQLAGGAMHMCGLTSDGSAYCWGRGGFGELGTGQQNPAGAPVPVASALKYTRIAAGGSHSCAVTAAGDVYCWGSNTTGELGTQTSESCSGAATYSITCSTTAVRVPNIPKAVDVAAGFHHSCALAVSGAVYCWGAGTNGQLGQGTASDSNAPVRVKDTK